MVYSRTVKRFSVGILTVFTLYYVGFSWLPVSFVESRVLKFLIVAEPLLALYPLDFIVISILIMFTLHLYGYRLVKALPLAILPLIVYMSYLLLGSHRVLSLTSIIVLVALYYVFKRGGLEEVVLGFSYTIIAVELAAIISSLSFFTLGSWSGIAKAVVIRERLIWGFIEWFSIPLIIASSFIWLYTLLTNSKHPLQGLSGKLRSEKGSMCIVGGRALGVSLILVWVTILLPHLPSVNPSLKPVSVDTFYYMKFFKCAEEYGLAYALNELRGYGRPVYLTLLYMVNSVVGDPILLMDIIHPLISLSLLVIVVYIVVRRFVGDRAASITALLTSIGHSTITFIAGGFQANSLALPIALCLFIIEPKSTVKLFTTLLIVALIHPWTFVMFSTAYLFYVWRVRRESLHGTLRVLALTLIALLVSEVVDRVVSNVSPSGLAVRTVTSSFNFNVIANVFRGFEFWTWGSQANAPILLASSISWVTTPASTLLAVIAPLTLISTSMIIHRLFLNIPLEMLAATVLVRVDRYVAIALILSAITRSLIVLTGMTPLIGSVWEKILL